MRRRGIAAIAYIFDFINGSDDESNAMRTILRKTIDQFINDDCMTLAASLAYYTLFAMPPLLFLLVTIVSAGLSATFDQELADQRAEKFLQQQAAQLIGNDAAAQEIGKMIDSSRRESGTWWKSILSLTGVLVGATGLFTALQASLNRVWSVKPDGQFAKQFLMKRLLSLGMIVAFGFLLFVSFIVSTLLYMLTDFAAVNFGLAGNWPFFINHSVSFLSTWIFFAVVFRVMPDAKVTWKDAACGGLFTVLLFTLGRVILFYYLSTASPGAQLGSAAASLVVILIWVYYSSLILLFGAEFTANLSTQPIEPLPGAMHVEEHVSETVPVSPT